MYSYFFVDIVLTMVKILFLQKFEVLIRHSYSSECIRLIYLNAQFSITRELFVR